MLKSQFVTSSHGDKEKKEFKKEASLYKDRKTDRESLCKEREGVGEEERKCV